MINRIFNAATKIFSKSTFKVATKYYFQQASKSGHHKKAISDGLRKGSTEAARVMAKWRWG